MNQPEVSQSDNKLPEIAFAVDLIQFVLNEHQIKWNCDKVSFGKEMKRLFTKDFGKLVMFKWFVWNKVFDYLIHEMFPNDIFDAHFILNISDGMFSFQQLFFSSITMFCALMSHLTLYYARSGRFTVVNEIKNILSYTTLKYRNKFLEYDDGWSGFNGYVKEYNSIHKIADAA